MSPSAFIRIRTEFNQLPKTACIILNGFFIVGGDGDGDGGVERNFRAERGRKPICEQLLLISDDETAERPGSYMARTVLLCRRFRPVTCNRNNRVYHCGASILNNPHGSGTMTHTRTKSNPRYCHCYWYLPCPRPSADHVMDKQIYDDQTHDERSGETIIRIGTTNFNSIKYVCIFLIF